VTLPEHGCSVCGASTGNPYTSLDRRILRRTQSDSGSKPATLLIEVAQEMFCYCDMVCGMAHAGQLSQYLQLKHAFPTNSEYVQCSQCGETVDRSHTHVAYTFLTALLTEAPESYVAAVIGDVEFAVFCQTCEQPESPDQEGAMAPLNRQLVEA
jgi:hypothetical protein